VESPPPLTALDQLARTHALLLSQIIQVLDGDMLSYSSAESTRPFLECSALALLQYVDSANPDRPTPDILPLYPAASTKEFWKSWIFQESARRTVLLSLFFLSAQRLLKGESNLRCDEKIYLVHEWTFSAHLWNAKDAFQFAQAWKEKNHYVINQTK
jgi:hypothetical protein